MCSWCCAFAEEIGLDVESFELDLNSESTIEQLNEEMHMARSIGAQGFPSLILKSNKFAEAEETKLQALKKPQWQNVPYDYNDARVTLRHLWSLLKEASTFKLYLPCIVQGVNLPPILGIQHGL